MTSSGKAELEYRILHKDGSIRYIHKKALLTKHKDSNLSMINGVCSDITSKKMVEAQARENARIREEILESITDAFYAVDKQWNFTYINKEFETMLGVKREDLLGKNVWDYFSEPKNLKFYRACHRAVQEQVSVKIEEYYAPLKIWIKSSAYPTPEGLTVYMQDVTQEKALRVAVEKSEQYLSALINSTQDLIWIVGPDLEIVTANRAYCRIVEMITKQRVMIGDRAFHFALEENFNEKWGLYYQRALQGESFRREEEFFTKREPKYLEISFIPIVVAGAVMGVGCIARDITDSKKSMARIRWQNEKLKEIAHVQSHDLRRPVATILGLVALFDKQDLSSLFNAELIDKVEMVCQELDAVIHQIVAKTVELEK